MKFNIHMPVVIAVLSMTGTLAFAQESPAPTLQQQQRPRLRADEKIDLEINHMDSIVHLTADQKEQLKQLFTTISTQRKQNKAEAAGDRDKQRELDKPLGQQKKEGINRILTHEQRVLLKEERQDQKTKKLQDTQPVPQPGR